MPGDLDRDVLETLLQRSPVLRELVDEPRRKPELVSALDVSRSTVDRAIRDLEGLDFAERVDGGVRSTLAGRLALDSLEEFADRVGATTALSDMLRHVGPDSGLTPDVLVGSELYLGEQPAPYQVATRLESIIEDAASVRVLKSTISNTGSVEVIADAVVDGTEFEVVYELDLARFLAQDRDEARARMAESDGYRAFCVEEVPCDLLVVDRHDGETFVVIVVYDDDVLRGMILNEGEAAVAWGEDLYERCRRSAWEITPAFGGGDAPDELAPFNPDDGPGRGADSPGSAGRAGDSAGEE